VWGCACVEAPCPRRVPLHLLDASRLGLGARARHPQLRLHLHLLLRPARGIHRGLQRDEPTPRLEDQLDQLLLLGHHQLDRQILLHREGLDVSLVPLRLMLIPQPPLLVRKRLLLARERRRL
jgi:hypothetical protein